MDDTTAALLAELKQAIADLEAGTGDQDRVADLAGRIERRLGAEAELTDADDSVAEELREGAIRFESDHPQAASAIRRIIDGLNGLGL
jgi:hypothetical protein